MSTSDIGFKNGRIERLVSDRTGDRRWRVTEAKARLSDIIQLARSGTVQLIGKRDPVIVITVGELESLITSFSEPETWGERFLPPVSEKGLGDALELPVHSLSVLDNFDFQGEYADGLATEDVAKSRPTQKRGVD